MKVKCIDNEDWVDVLTIGKIYEVLFEWSTGYRILCDDNQTYFVAKDRFEIVEEEDNNMEDSKNKFYNIDIFNWEDFKNGKIAVLCNTEELARDFLHKCDEQCIMWGHTKPSDNIHVTSSRGRCVTTYSIDDCGFGYSNYGWYQSKNIKVIPWEINNNEIEKTFQEVIATIKEREIWVCEKYDRKIIKGDDGIIEIRKLNNKTFDHITALIIGDEKYKLQRKEYTFEEAFKAYEEGKEIESCESKSRYKKQKGNDSYFDVFIKDWWSGNTIALSLQEIREKWYIND